MTNKEAIIAEIQVSQYSDNAITKAMLDLDINPEEEYVKDNAKRVAIAAIKVLRSMLSVKSVTEGGYNITYSISERIDALNAEYGLLPVVEVPKPSIKARSLW